MKTNLNYEELMLTPALAAAFIATNSEHQRPLKKSWVRRLAGIISRGGWEMNGSPIQFDADGRMVNGNHRCHAVIEAQVAVPICVIRGVPANSVRSIGEGIANQFKDELARDGELNTATLAAAVRFLFFWENERFAWRNNPVKAPNIEQLYETLSRHPDIRRSTSRSKRNLTLMPPSITSFTHYLFARIDAEFADDTFEKIATGAGLEKGDALLLLRERLLKVKAQKKARLDSIEMIALVLKAVEAHRVGKKLVTLRWRSADSDDHRAERFPEIGA